MSNFYQEFSGLDHKLIVSCDYKDHGYCDINFDGSVYKGIYINHDYEAILSAEGDAPTVFNETLSLFTDKKGHDTRFVFVIDDNKNIIDYMEEAPDKSVIHSVHMDTASGNHSFDFSVYALGDYDPYCQSFVFDGINYSDSGDIKASVEDYLLLGDSYQNISISAKNPNDGVYHTFNVTAKIGYMDAEIVSLTEEFVHKKHNIKIEYDIDGDKNAVYVDGKLNNKYKIS